MLGTRFRRDDISHVKSADRLCASNRSIACGVRTPLPVSRSRPPTSAMRYLDHPIYRTVRCLLIKRFARPGLSRRCKRPVQFQNLASISYISPLLAIQTRPAPTLQPTPAITIMVTFDFRQSEPNTTNVTDPAMTQRRPTK